MREVGGKLYLHSGPNVYIDNTAIYCYKWDMTQQATSAAYLPTFECKLKSKCLHSPSQMSYPEHGGFSGTSISADGWASQASVQPPHLPQDFASLWTDRLWGLPWTFKGEDIWGFCVQDLTRTYLPPTYSKQTSFMSGLFSGVVMGAAVSLSRRHHWHVATTTTWFIHFARRREASANVSWHAEDKMASAWLMYYLLPSCLRGWHGRTQQGHLLPSKRNELCGSGTSALRCISPHWCTFIEERNGPQISRGHIVLVYSDTIKIQTQWI